MSMRDVDFRCFMCRCHFAVTIVRVKLHLPARAMPRVYIAPRFFFECTKETQKVERCNKMKRDVKGETGGIMINDASLSFL